jgi:hypothetical protein
MPKLDDQISTLQVKLEQLKLRQQRIDARKRAIAGHRERKADTRRKILLGGLMLEKMRRSDVEASRITAWLDQTLTRTDDRALFGLPARIDDRELERAGDSLKDTPDP